jgi:DNA-binding response OmpR family regulator
MSIRVLLIDDDTRLPMLLGGVLRDSDLVLSYASSGSEGLSMLSSDTYDAVLLDIMMPRMNGLDVLRTIRERSRVPIIMLTAKGDETDRVLGLELGADDYVTKPFSSRELLARIRAVLRRMVPAFAEERLCENGVEVRTASREVLVEGQPVELTGLELDILVALMRRPGRVVSRSSLLSEAGREETVGHRTVDVHISNVRGKIGADRIKTVRGVGYVFKRGEG